MLSLFKDQDIPITEENSIEKFREILISFLNKGIIPDWDTFLRELPSDYQDDIINKIQERFLDLTEWTFLNNLISEDTTEFFFHGPNKIQFINKNGKKINTNIKISSEDWQLWLEMLSIYYKQNWNVTQPFVSFYGILKGKNFRFSLIHSSTSPQKISKLILRSLASTPYSIESFGETEILSKLVSEQNNILIAGSTGSGKTSLLTSLLSMIDQNEHLIVLEDTYEILTHHPHQTRLLAGSSPETSLKSYLSYCMRLSPDRIILGEMRSHEVVPFLLAMNTGHKGLMGTIHASTAVDALNRVSLLFNLFGGEGNLSYDKVMELVCRNIEYVVFMENKKVKEIIKILGVDQGMPFYEKVYSSKKDIPEINLTQFLSR